MQNESSMTPKPSTLRPMMAVVILNLALLVVVGYSFHDRGQASAQAKRLSSQNDHAMAALSQTRGQVETLNAKISELEAAEQARQSAAVVAAVATAAPKPPESKPTVRVRRDDPRWKEVQSALDEHGQAIDSTRQELDAARVELGDSIARTHSELVALEKQGERNFYEFDIVQGKKFQRHGPLSVRLKKTSMKHSFADLELMVDDNKLTQKHVNLNQPVLFYVNGSDQPVEVVINDVKFNSVHGYVSESKYKPSELGTDAPIEDGSAARQQLQVRTQQ
jgi:hypothetical protein